MSVVGVAIVLASGWCLLIATVLVFMRAAARADRALEAEPSIRPPADSPAPVATRRAPRRLLPRLRWALPFPASITASALLMASAAAAFTGAVIDRTGKPVVRNEPAQQGEPSELTLTPPAATGDATVPAEAPALVRVSGVGLPPAGEIAAADVPSLVGSPADVPTGGKPSSGDGDGGRQRGGEGNGRGGDSGGAVSTGGRGGGSASRTGGRRGGGPSLSWRGGESKPRPPRRRGSSRRPGGGQSSSGGHSHKDRGGGNNRGGDGNGADGGRGSNGKGGSKGKGKG